MQSQTWKKVNLPLPQNFLAQSSDFKSNIRFYAFLSLFVTITFLIPTGYLTNLYHFFSYEKSILPLFLLLFSLLLHEGITQIRSKKTDWYIYLLVAFGFATNLYWPFWQCSGKKIMSNLLALSYLFFERYDKRNFTILMMFKFTNFIGPEPKVIIDQSTVCSGLTLYISGFIGVKIYYCLLSVRYWIKDNGTVTYSQRGQLTEAKLILLPTLLLLGIHWCLNPIAAIVLTITLLLFNSILLAMTLAIGDELYLLFKHSIINNCYYCCFRIHQRQYMFTYKKGICDCQCWSNQLKCLLCNEIAVVVNKPCGHRTLCRVCCYRGRYYKGYKQCIICKVNIDYPLFVRDKKRRQGYQGKFFVERKLARNQSKMP